MGFRDDFLRAQLQNYCACLEPCKHHAFSAVTNCLQLVFWIRWLEKPEMRWKRPELRKKNDTQNFSPSRHRAFRKSPPPVCEGTTPCAKHQKKTTSDLKPAHLDMDAHDATPSPDNKIPESEARNVSISLPLTRDFVGATMLWKLDRR